MSRMMSEVCFCLVTTGRCGWRAFACLAYRLLLFSQEERALMHGKGLVAKGLGLRDVARRRVSLGSSGEALFGSLPKQAYAKSSSLSPQVQPPS